MKKLYTITSVLILVACSTVNAHAEKNALVEYAGSQKTIFDTGKAEGAVPLTAMSGENASFAVAAAAGLDGEITVFQGKPYVTQVRGANYTVDHSQNHSAIFAVWTKNTEWNDEEIPTTVKDYLDLQRFVKSRAEAAGIDVTKPFPFLITGTPVELKWHINVDRTEGKPIDRKLFAESKAGYVLKGEPVDIVGFYSEVHQGVFISAYAPGIKDKEVNNKFHFHFISKKDQSSGHIDDILLAGGMTLRLPKN